VSGSSTHDYGTVEGMRFLKVSGCLGAKASKFTPGFSNLGAKASGYF